MGCSMEHRNEVQMIYKITMATSHLPLSMLEDIDPIDQHIQFSATASFNKTADEIVEVARLDGVIVKGHVRGTNVSLEVGMDESNQLSTMWWGLLKAEKKLPLRALELYSKIIVLETLRVPPEFRGFNIGANLIEATVDTLEDYGCLFILVAYPIPDQEDQPRIPEKQGGLKGKKSLISYYEKVGFKLINQKSGLMALDPEYIRKRLPVYSPFDFDFHAND